MRADAARERIQLLEDFISRHTDRSQAIQKLLTANELSQIFKTTNVTVSAWNRSGELVATEKDGQSFMFRVDHVLEQLACIAADRPNLRAEMLKTQTQEIVPVQLMPQVRHATIETTARRLDGFDDIRSRANKAARDAYRDVILEEADKAKARGDKDLAIQLYEDFIHAEEGLKVIHSEGARP